MQLRKAVHHEQSDRQKALPAMKHAHYHADACPGTVTCRRALQAGFCVCWPDNQIPYTAAGAVLPAVQRTADGLSGPLQDPGAQMLRHELAGGALAVDVRSRS